MTHVPSGELDQDVSVDDMYHEPSGFISGAFKESQLRWLTVDKEASAVVCIFRRLMYLVWDGAVIFCYHQTLAHILHPGANEPSMSKAANQRLQ